MTTIRTVAIIGAGQMGSGIAQTVATGGYEVRLYDLSAERIPLAQGEIAASLARRAARGLMTQAEADAALARIQIADSLADAVRGADLVVTAMAEGRHAAQGIMDFLEVKSIPLH